MTAQPENGSLPAVNRLVRGDSDPITGIESNYIKNSSLFTRGVVFTLQEIYNHHTVP